jgi:hypothetical protein
MRRRAAEAILQQEVQQGNRIGSATQGHQYSVTGIDPAIVGHAVPELIKNACF